ncbi:Putative secreted lipase [Plesiocystis pacifica SIR-1]|uniref:Putative secreted lipase n=1 Tax=Plesiocystis pacifica SIR-1 TaxID=391625 RepID=A6GF19_9BACT|nr:hypothetical protein [Plesiocystis pacifica]EDM75546.1 Putative secreted lipase [Plesiocystis pacifica SIR-1]
MTFPSPRRLLVPLSLSALIAGFGPLACSDDGGGDDEVGEDTDIGGGEAEDGTEDAEETSETETETGGPDRDELIAELEALGPHEVGYRELEFTYTGADGSERIIPTRVWYPAEAGSGADPATYAVAGIVEIPTEVALDAPPVAAGSFPTVVYSHGSGGEALLAYPFAERFASHGWIVYSANHVGNTALDALGGTSQSFIEMMVHRPSDVSAMLDEADGGFGGDPIGAAADLDNVFVFGHSFGGYTTFALGGVAVDYDNLLSACSPSDCAFLEEPGVADAVAGLADARVDAISPQAPALYSSFDTPTYGTLEVPTLLQSGKLDLTTPDGTEAQPAWDALANPDDVWVDMPFGAHYSFITICHDLDPELVALFQPNNEADGCGDEFTPTEEAVPVLGTYLMAYARAHVLGDTDFTLIFDGEPLHPEFDVSMH